jgi:hypothetical protein
MAKRKRTNNYLQNTTPKQKIPTKNVVELRCSGRVSSPCSASSVINRRFEPQFSQTKDNKIDVCCVTAMHAGLRSNSKYWLVLNHDTVSEWKDLSFPPDRCFSELAV